VDANGAGRRLLVRDGQAAAFSPDGSRIAFAEHFDSPGDDLERLMYGFSIVHCLAVARADAEDSAATGTVMRPDTLRRYAEEAGFADVDVLDIENEFWRFYRLRPPT